MTQCPEKVLVPVFPLLSLLYLDEGSCDTFVRLVNALINSLALFGLETVFALPDIE